MSRSRWRRRSDLKAGEDGSSGVRAIGQANQGRAGSASSVTQGRIIFVAAVADAASGTLRVRIEVPNKARRPAGEHVLVTF